VNSCWPGPVMWDVWIRGMRAQSSELRSEPLGLSSSRGACRTVDTEEELQDCTRGRCRS
jgi:hypothetical protein